MVLTLLLKATWFHHYLLANTFSLESIIALVRITRQRSLTETYNVGRCLKLKD
nr:MAG TPA: hypothetical protein [Caudoviricetes sp.]